MSDLPQLGQYLIVVGIFLVGLGGLFIVSGHLDWFGQLPGDIYIEGDNYSFYFPLTTCVFLSVILSLLLYLVGR